jgi:tetratricopeptide (TPR) repeat protein
LVVRGIDVSQVAAILQRFQDYFSYGFDLRVDTFRDHAYVYASLRWGGRLEQSWQIPTFDERTEFDYREIDSIYGIRRRFGPQMTTIALSPRLPATGDSLKLTDGRSARWFVEALKLLRQFDESSSKETLRNAKALLEQCANSYPQDLLPSFYLAVTDSVLGDLDQSEAIKRFELFTQSDQFEVSAAAKYNLAAAYIETYDDVLYSKAETILDQLIGDLRARGAPVEIPKWFFPIFTPFSSRDFRVEPLYYQALEAGTYVNVHVHIWARRWDTKASGEIAQLANNSLVQLRSRQKAIKKHESFLGEQRPEIWAWHWNNVGFVQEALAANALLLDRPDPAAAREAEKACGLALQADPGFGSARSNLGRLYLEVIPDLDKAAEILTETLRGAEDTDYTHYNLSLLRTLQGDRKAALEHLRQAPEMLRHRGYRGASWFGARIMAANELRKWGRRKEALKLFKELSRERPGDERLQQHIANLDGGAS